MKLAVNTTRKCAQRTEFPQNLTSTYLQPESRKTLFLESQSGTTMAVMDQLEGFNRRFDLDSGYLYGTVCTCSDALQTKNPSYDLNELRYPILYCNAYQRDELVKAVLLIREPAEVDQNSLSGHPFFSS